MKTFRDFAHTLSQRLLKATSTKYFAVLLLAAVWMLFFDRYRLVSRYKVSQRIEQLQADKQYYQQELKDLAYQQHKRSNLEELERLAREKYHMKRRHEDVYVTN